MIHLRDWVCSRCSLRKFPATSRQATRNYSAALSQAREHDADARTPTAAPGGGASKAPRARRIAAAAKTLEDLRRAWLNPPDLVDIAPEITPTAAPGEATRRYPDLIPPNRRGGGEAQGADG